MTHGHIRAYRSEAVKAAKLLAARDKAMHERAAAIARAIEEGSIADESEAASVGFPEIPDDNSEDDSSSPWSVPGGQEGMADVGVFASVVRRVPAHDPSVRRPEVGEVVHRLVRDVHPVDRVHHTGWWSGACASGAS